MLTRREFAAGLIVASATLQGQLAGDSMPAPGGKWRAVIIGHTGQGDYGHSLDTIFNGRDDVETLAVADPDTVGRTKAVERSKALRQYSDYHEMLPKEKPQLVCLAPRWTNQRLAMGLAALRAGAHIFSEKPFTATLAEADELLTVANRAGLKITVAHQMRLDPGILRLKQRIADGVIGELLEIRAWGKQDDRAGGEDMIVLGSHLFDLIRFLAGDALSCTARVLHRGKDITRQDARHVREQIGPMAGDEVEAQFAFAKGVNATFISRQRLRQSAGPWGIELIGSQATVRILADVSPAVYLLKPSAWETAGRTDEWRRFERDQGPGGKPEERGFGPANRRLVDDWLEAIQKNREPICSGRAAMKSLEMIMAVYHAALAGRRVTLPLADRKHPLNA